MESCTYAPHAFFQFSDKFSNNQIHLSKGIIIALRRKSPPTIVYSSERTALSKKSAEKNDDLSTNATTGKATVAKRKGTAATHEASASVTAVHYEEPETRKWKMKCYSDVEDFAKRRIEDWKDKVNIFDYTYDCYCHRIIEILIAFQSMWDCHLGT